MITTIFRVREGEPTLESSTESLVLASVVPIGQRKLLVTHFPILSTFVIVPTEELDGARNTNVLMVA